MQLTDFKPGEQVIWFKPKPGGFARGTVKTLARVMKIGSTCVAISYENYEGKKVMKYIDPENLEKISTPESVS